MWNIGREPGKEHQYYKKWQCPSNEVKGKMKVIPSTMGLCFPVSFYIAKNAIKYAHNIIQTAEPNHSLLYDYPNRSESPDSVRKYSEGKL